MRPAELVSSHSGGLYKTPDETNGQPVGIPSAAVEWEYPQDAHDNGEYAKRDHETKSQPPSERPSWGKNLHGNLSSSLDLHTTRRYVAARAPCQSKTASPAYASTRCAASGSRLLYRPVMYRRSVKISTPTTTTARVRITIKSMTAPPGW